MSKHELAEVAGLDKNWPTEAERGYINPTLETLEKLALALDVDVAELIADSLPSE